MAKGRFLSANIATDRALGYLSIGAELLYIKAIPHLDRDGLILGDGPVLWARICPRRVDLMDVMDDVVDEWLAQDLVVAYDTPDGRVLYFRGFQKNQQGLRYERESPSSYPPPPGYIRTPTGIQPDSGQSDAGAHPEPPGAHPEPPGAHPDIISIYQDAAGKKPTKRTERELERLLAEHGLAAIQAAFDVADDNGKGGQLSYVKGILKRSAQATQNGSHGGAADEWIRATA